MPTQGQIFDIPPHPALIFWPGWPTEFYDILFLESDAGPNRILATVLPLTRPPKVDLWHKKADFTIIISRLSRF